MKRVILILIIWGVGLVLSCSNSQENTEVKYPKKGKYKSCTVYMFRYDDSGYIDTSSMKVISKIKYDEEGREEELLDYTDNQTKSFIFIYLADGRKIQYQNLSFENSFFGNVIRQYQKMSEFKFNSEGNLLQKNEYDCNGVLINMIHRYYYRIGLIVLGLEYNSYKKIVNYCMFNSYSKEKFFYYDSIDDLWTVDFYKFYSDGNKLEVITCNFYNKPESKRIYIYSIF